MDELVRRAAAIVPVLHARADWGERHRRLHDEALEAMADAGVLRLRAPAAHGGHEADLGTVLRVVAELARGDGSAAWTAAVWAVSTWVAGRFPDHVRQEVFATPDARITGILSPTATAAPVPGGVLVNGRWAFTTGAPQCDWTTNAALLAPHREPVVLALPVADLEVVDDWHTTGLRATAGVTTLARDVFVPEDRVLPLRPLLGGDPDDARALFRAPYTPAACATVGGPAVGLVRAALRLAPDGPRTREAAVLADGAELHANRAASVVDAKVAARGTWTPKERAWVRQDLVEACLRAKDAVDVLTGDDPVLQRVRRDVHALSLHAVLHPNANLERYAQVFAGGRDGG